MSSSITRAGAAGQSSAAIPTSNESQAPTLSTSAPRTTPAVLHALQRTEFKISGARVFLRTPQSGKVGVVVPENNIGRIPQGETANICYPNISSCLTVSGLSRNGSLRGGHLTTPEGIRKDDMDTLLKAIGAQDCTKFVVAGPIEQIKARTDESAYGNRKNITAELNKLAPNAEVGFVDTEKAFSPSKPPYNVYVQHDRQQSASDLQVHIAPAQLSTAAGVTTAKIPDDASIPSNAQRVADGDIVQRKPSGILGFLPIGKKT
ncbi:hypothetical protein [Burkholderia oklahomensis]|uniref:hypothetical protein n=1 Tax=Burkholderia oklahomensis TaxID=342113 RepID=UPI0005721B9B|nr:hypothetical protein [Burkholderia oklahomensis]AOI39684.1 hypothetical protein WG70_08645 [Burkholderia oklahomensis EO147]KUY67769.1 hypothetical protein WG70_26405 [Burkholderia oklahomensis EO147]QPS39961.1 hypothetical protein I6G57_29670 [Burkholderia oklahomensis]